MRDVTWKVFELTGDVYAYLLYRACQQAEQLAGDEPPAEEDELHQDSHFQTSLKG
ncbi:YqzL family protein [Alicyclobacillus vulcanalis]|uniref:YqzL-like protein n=1 Tax=Alicyclobacillus vulcanalis TaxID=252246 RepID=A0A1N7KYJ8_9BACL|nr:YqzL family protein [Alicyclobacillus vulcanalis]SIS66617.1 YqzL-like protein [Alicyclobacillus vulcanalis]